MAGVDQTLSDSSGSGPDSVAPEPLRTPDADRALVRAILSRDRKATAEFVSLYSDTIYAYVRRRLLPRTDLADDLVQEVFLAALNGLANYAGASSLQTWLLGIARHKVEDYYRECLRQPELLSNLDEEGDELQGPAIEYDDMLDSARRQQRVVEVLAGLPEIYRVVLRWRYWGKRTGREMAEQSGKTEKAVERLLARARRAFRRRWEEG